MAITISGENNNDRILAQDGVIDQISGINIVGLLTAGHINVGNNIQLGNAGVATATTFNGNVTGNINNTTLLLQTGGYERIRITSAGRVEVKNGTLDLGTADTSSGHLNAAEVLTFNIDTDNDDTNRYFAFYKNGKDGSGTELVRIKEDGGVGIGSAIPSAKLDIAGNIEIKDSTAEYRFTVSTNSNEAEVSSRARSGAYRNTALLTNSFIVKNTLTNSPIERLRIAADGVITSTQTTPVITIKGTNANANSQASVLFNLRDGNSNNYDIARVFAQTDASNGGYGKILVQTAFNNTLYTRIQIDKDGAVQIGQKGGATDLPGATSALNVRAMTDGNLHVRPSTDIVGGTTGVALDVLNNASNALKDLILRGQTVIFRNSAESLRIASDGKVGINQASPRTTLDVTGYVYLGNGGQIQITGSAGAKGLQLAGADDGDNIIGTMGSSGENLVFRTASSPRMRLLVGGPHLLIGGTSGLNEITESSSNSGLVIGNTSMGNGGLAIINSTSGTGRIYFGDATGSDTARNRGQINYYHNGDYMLFATAGTERLRIASTGKIYVKGNGGDVSTDFSDAGTFFNLKHDTYGGRIGFGNGTASQGVTLMEQLGYWGSNKVAGWVMTAGGDAANRDDGAMSFYTRESGQGIMERLHIGTEGEVVVGYRVGTSTVRSNQPVAFHSARVTPDGNPRRVSTGQRCNLFVGSNSGWAAGDGGTLGLGGSETGGAGVEAMWSYLKGARQSGNGWEYAGYFELGTSPWSGTNMAKRVKIWADGQIEIYPTDSTFFSTQIGGAQRMKIQHTGGGNVSITNSNGTMTYGSTSDYRLKKDEAAITNALSTVKALKPYQFTWKNDDKLGQGFLAHEAQAVLPDIGVVSGTKDAVHTEDPVKDEHHTKGDPIYQSVDYSKLVPLLTAALQEASAKIETLEAKVAALEVS